MKKFLSKVLTLALVCAIVVTGTSITSEAKAATTTYSSNAVINDFVATAIKSNGLVIGGKSYNSQEAITLAYAANPAVTTSPMYWQQSEIVHDDGTVTDIGYLCWGFYLYADGSTGRNPGNINSEGIYGLDMTEPEFDYSFFDDGARLSTNGVWNTNAFIANGINAQYICAWMQSRGLNTASDIYNYLVANGATFTVNPDFICYDGTMQSFVCVQCPNLSYVIDNDGSGASILYNNENLSGVNVFEISSGTGAITISNVVDSQIFEDVPVTDFYSDIQH